VRRDKASSVYKPPRKSVAAPGKGARSSRAKPKPGGKVSPAVAAALARSCTGSSAARSPSPEPGAASDAAVHDRHLLAALMESSPDYIYFKDMQSRFIRISKALADHFGLSDPSEAIGKSDADFYGAEHASRAYADEQEVIRTGRPLVGKEERVEWPDGHVTWGLTTKVPLRNVEGRIVGTFGISRDITSHKLAEEALSDARGRAQTYLDVAGVIIVALDADGKVTLINQKGCAILGGTETDVLAENWFDRFVPSRCREEVWKGFQKLMAGRLKSAEYFENPVRTLGGEERLIAWHNTVLKDNDGKIVGVLSSGQDITERTQAEQRLQTYRDQLRSLAAELVRTEEHERRQLAANLHDSVAQVLAAARIKTRELQSVLRSGSGTAAAAKDEQAAPADLASSLEQVLALIEQALEDTRTSILNLGPPVLYEVGFVAAVEWLVERTRAEHGICATFQDDGRAHPLDEEVSAALFRAVAELLNNVVNHAQAKHVTVGVEQVGRRPGVAGPARAGELRPNEAGPEIRIRVEDDGVGFDPEEVQRRTDLKGGFGLFGVRERLAYFGGRMAIRSEHGRGTTVELVAPLRRQGTEG